MKQAAPRVRRAAGRGKTSKGMGGDGAATMRWLLRRYDSTYRRGNWSGWGPLKAITGLSSDAAHWRPHAGQHTIAEMVLHMAYWKDFVRAGLRGEPIKLTEEDNWRTVPPTEEGWAQARAELEAAHRRLRKTLQNLDPKRLQDTVRRQWRVIDFVGDIATHDTYHGAQIFVLRHLFEARRASEPNGARAAAG